MGSARGHDFFRSPSQPQTFRAWQVRCLIFIGAGDADFLDLARRAASEIPDAEFISLLGLDHYGAHTGQDDPLLDAILRMLRGRADSSA
jgi:hypothetical protein